MDHSRLYNADWVTKQYISFCPYIFPHLVPSRMEDAVGILFCNIVILRHWALWSFSPVWNDSVLGTVLLTIFTLHWRHHDHGGVSNHQPHGCLLNRLFRCRSKKTAKLRVTGLCVGNSPVTGEFPAQMASYAENVSIWWRHHVRILFCIHPNLK